MQIEQRVEFPCEVAAGREAARQLKAFLAAHGFSDDLQFACELSLTEACNNAVHHCPQNGGNHASLIAAEVRLESGAVELRVIDHTPGFVYPGKVPPPAPDIKAGRGLFLIQSMMDEVRYERDTPPGRNTLVMRKRMQQRTEG